MNRLTKSSNKLISGVIGGIAEYFGISSGWLRFGFFLLLIIPGLFFPLFIIYVIAAIVMPESDGTVTGEESVKTSRRGLLIIGITFVVLGILFLLNQVLHLDLMYYFRYFMSLGRDYIIAIVLVVVGLLLIFKSSNAKVDRSDRDGVTLQREEVTEIKEVVEEDDEEDGVK